MWFLATVLDCTDLELSNVSCGGVERPLQIARAEAWGQCGRVTESPCPVLWREKSRLRKGRLLPKW